MNFLFKWVMKKANPIQLFINKMYEKHVKELIYLKTGYHADLTINEVELADENGRVRLHADFDLSMDSKEFYDILDKIAK